MSKMEYYTKYKCERKGCHKITLSNWASSRAAGHHRCGHCGGLALKLEKVKIIT